ncbi:sensor histidine kinase [Horticoccus sp. 23ND18S-11]|uniref:sensor histidine kinase n=1 Tax=Horticoccus sp. 23ND18S-11 TaxID=3391832 RepID=UPI0039C8D123
MKRRFAQLPIATKLRVIITLSCVVVVFLTCVALALVEWHDVRRTMVRMLIARSEIIAAGASAALLVNSPREAEDVLNALRADRNLLGGTIFRADGSVFAQYAVPGTAVMPPAPGPGIVHLFSWRDVLVWVPVQGEAGQISGTIALRMALTVIYDRLRLYAMSSLVVALAVVGFAYWLSHRLQGLISRPLLALEAAAARVTQEKDFTVRVAPAMDDEIGRLTTAFNSMLETIQAGEAESARLYDQVRAYATGLETRVKERTAQLQSAYDELESFSYSVSHDLRGPARHIAFFAEMMVEEAGPGLAPESAAYAGRIVQSARRMEGLIDALLDFARLTRKEPVIEPIDMAALCRDTVAELQADPANAKAEITVGALSACQADPILVRQILVNLLGNAFKYSRDRSPPRIAVYEVKVDGPERRAYAVRDNGVGFDSGTAADLFKVFVRFHDKNRFEGTGVGLATVQRIVQRLGGRIWAESAVDAGATFFFTLPRVESPGPAVEAPERARATVQP